jgi:hypothetical protein
MSRHEKKPSKLLLFGGLTLFGLMTIGGLGYFLFVAINMLGNLLSLPDHISFDKGAFYLPGVSIGLAALIYAGVYESCLEKTLTEKHTRQITKFAISGIIIMFLFPHLAHYLTDQFLQNKKYEICREVSRQWLHSRTIVYVRDAGVCSELIEKT